MFVTWLSICTWSAQVSVSDELNYEKVWCLCEQCNIFINIGHTMSQIYFCLCVCIHILIFCAMWLKMHFNPIIKLTSRCRPMRTYEHKGKLIKREKVSEIKRCRVWNGGNVWWNELSALDRKRCVYLRSSRIYSRLDSLCNFIVTFKKSCIIFSQRVLFSEWMFS